jgi:MFS transporter, DHA2 family, multidrug resistance protein
MAHGHGQMAQVTGTARTMAFVALLLGSLATMLNTSVVNVALPRIASELGADGVEIDLIADGDSIALTALVLLFGAIGDKYGRKKMFLTGSLLLALFSLLCSLAGSADQLVLGRLAVGAASAMLFPTTLSMATGLYPGTEERAKAVAIWTGVAAVGAAVAPILSGWLIHAFDWPAIFLLSVPIALVAAALAWRLLPEQRDAAMPGIDWLGGFFAACMLSGLLLATILTPMEGFNALTLAVLAVGIAGLIGFILQERRAANPLLDLAAFRERPFSGGAAVILLLFLSLSGLMYLAAQFTQNVLGYSPLEAGFAVLPVTLGVIGMTPFNVPLARRFGPRVVGASGLLLMAAGLLSVLLWTTDSSYPVIGLSFGLIGIGLGLAMAPNTSAILGTLPQEKAGVASAVNDLTRDFGGALGVAIMGALASVTYAGVLAQAYADLPPAEQASIPENVYRVARSSLSGALSIANAYPGPDADALVVVARQAFLDGQARAALAGAGLALVGLVIAWTCLPKREA